jgi:hypothetical protein
VSDYNTKKNPQSAVAVDEERRSFLRKSIYAAYATPLITALLVEEASAGWSGCPPAKRAKCDAGQLPPAACRNC